MIVHIELFHAEPVPRKISGTEMVHLGHRLMVRKAVPFGALFWCPFAKGHWNLCFYSIFLYRGGFLSS